MNLRAVSLFSNCGAGDVGYREAGFSFEVMAELDERRLEVCLLNHPQAEGVPGDLRHTWPNVAAKYRERAGDEPPALLCACPPCQGVSSARGKRGNGENPDDGVKDYRNLLVEVIANVAKALNPLLIVVENVPAFLTRKIRHPDTNEAISAAELLVSRLTDAYETFSILTNLADYGVPQTRKRAFLTFVRRDLSGLAQLESGNRAPFPRPTHASDYRGSNPVTLREALREFKLASLDASSEEKAKDPNEDPLHSVPVWQDRRYQMVASIPPNSGKTAWETKRCGECGTVDVGDGDATCPRCGQPLLRPVVRQSNGTYRLVKGFRGSSYRRMRPDEPAATITTGTGHLGSHFTIHPYENRLFSPLECAYLQTFPDDFEWGDALKKWGHTNIRKMIGEAVPPLYTELHGHVLVGLLTGVWTSAPITRSDNRCEVASRKLGLPRPAQTQLPFTDS